MRAAWPPTTPPPTPPNSFGSGGGEPASSSSAHADKKSAAERPEDRFGIPSARSTTSRGFHWERCRSRLTKSQPPGSPPPPAPHDPWSSLGAARTQLGAVAPPRDPLTETAWYWTALFGLPLAVVLGALGTRGAHKLRARLSARGTSAERTIDDALSEARRASKSGNRGAVAASIDRAMHLAIEHATGLRARALLAREVTTALEQRQVPADLANQTSELLSTVETVRFSHPRSCIGSRRVGRARH